MKHLIAITSPENINNNITILLDDRILTSRLHKLNQKRYPNACLLPEYEIINAICTSIQQFPNSTLKYQKSTIIYNDMTDIEPLDECKSLLDIASQLQLQNTPIPKKLDTQNAELVLNNKLISTRYQSSILGGFTQPDLWTCYLNFFNWTQQCIDLIDWKSHGKALSYLPQRQQKTTIQFNHRWLPLNASHSLQEETTGRLCPLCKHKEETHQQFLQCPHPAPNLQWTTATQQIKTRLRAYNQLIVNILNKLIILALLEWRTTKTPQSPQFLQPQYHQLFYKQSLIGWDQIIQGRLAAQWTLLKHNIDPKVPKTWNSYTIQTIWYYVYNVVWKFRCNVNHGTNPQDKRQRALPRLTPKLASLYNKINEIDPADNNIFKKHRMKCYYCLHTL
jgi:hypothetical protein